MSATKKSPDKVAQEFLSLWQEQWSTLFTDPGLAESWQTQFSTLREGYVQTLNQFMEGMTSHTESGKDDD